MDNCQAKAILRKAKALDGSRTWKANVAYAWESGNYERCGFRTIDTELQQVRNAFGTGFLDRVKF